MCHLLVVGTRLIQGTPSPHPQKDLWEGMCGSWMSWEAACWGPPTWGAPSRELAASFHFKLIGMQRKTELLLTSFKHLHVLMMKALECYYLKPYNFKDGHYDFTQKLVCFLKYLFYLKTTVETLQFVSQQCKYFVTGFFAKMLVTQAKEPYSKEMFFLPWLTYKEWVYCSCCWKDFFVMLFHLTEWLLIVNSVSNCRIYYIIVFSGHTLFNFSTDVILLFFLYSALEVLQKML